MKKALLIAFAAFCAFAAQAVTLTWNTVDGNASSFDGKFATWTVSFNLSQTAGSVTSTVGDLSSAWLTSITFADRTEGQGNYTPAYAVIKDASGEVLGKSAPLETTSKGIVVKIDGGTNGNFYTRNAYTFNFDYIFVETNANYTLEFYNDADEAAQMGYSVVKNDPNGAGNWTPAMKITLSDTVPEPTALALLALGVAGLALKRKVA